MFVYLLYAGAALYLGVADLDLVRAPWRRISRRSPNVGRKVGDSRWVMAAGLLYTLGRCLLYLALAVLLAATAMSIPAVSRFLQNYMHMVLGPIFLLLGMFLVGLITFSGGGASMTEGMQKRIDSLGIWGALLLGVLFAVAFCPTSAAWFFGLLMLILGSEAGDIATVLCQDRHHPSNSVLARRRCCSAVDLRHWHRVARIAGRLSVGLQRQVGWQSIQHTLEDRVVGASDHRLGFFVLVVSTSR